MEMLVDEVKAMAKEVDQVFDHTAPNEPSNDRSAAQGRDGDLPIPLDFILPFAHSCYAHLCSEPSYIPVRTEHREPVHEEESAHI